MDHAVVDVEVPGVMGVYNFRLNPVDQVFHYLHDVQQRQRIETIIRQLVQQHILHADLRRRRVCLLMQSRQLALLSISPLRMSRSHALAQNGEVHLMAFANQASRSSPAAEHLIVRMGRDHQDLHLDVSFGLPRVIVTSATMRPSYRAERLNSKRKPE